MLGSEQVITDITADGVYQLESCGDCDVPGALREQDSETKDSLIDVMSAVQHIASHPDEDDAMRVEMEEKGLLELYQAAQQCLRCSRGMCILASGKNTPWRLGNFTIPE